MGQLHSLVALRLRKELLHVFNCHVAMSYIINQNLYGFIKIECVLMKLRMTQIVSPFPAL
jgi:hypothetical protein